MAWKERQPHRRVGHQGFLGQWLEEADQEQWLRDYDENLQSFGRRLPRSAPGEGNEPFRRDLVRSWPLR